MTKYVIITESQLQKLLERIDDSEYVYDISNPVGNLLQSNLYFPTKIDDYYYDIQDESTTILTLYYEDDKEMVIHLHTYYHYFPEDKGDCWTAPYPACVEYGVTKMEILEPYDEKIDKKEFHEIRRIIPWFDEIINEIEKQVDADYRFKSWGKWVDSYYYSRDDD